MPPTSFKSMPAPVQLRSLLQSLAMLDGVLAIELGEPVYAFFERWSDGASVATIKNGLGDEIFIVFERGKVFLKGFVHDRKQESNPEDLKGMVPTEFSKYLTEPAFEADDVTVFAWASDLDSEWGSTTVSMESLSYLLDFIKLTPQDFYDWAVDNYEEDLAIEAVASFYEHSPLSKMLLERLKPNCDLGKVRRMATEIGYPVAS